MHGEPGGDVLVGIADCVHDLEGDPSVVGSHGDLVALSTRAFHIGH
ncbi:MAG: Uncharacterised protein [Cellulomonadaceae bacterium TMED98]|nr:MAG: Uncharacterised protein [Cellulomonadaceae bacterium TMED98]